MGNHKWVRSILSATIFVTLQTTSHHVSFIKSVRSYEKSIFVMSLSLSFSLVNHSKTTFSHLETALLTFPLRRRRNDNHNSQHVTARKKSRTIRMLHR